MQSGLKNFTDRGRSSIGKALSTNSAERKNAKKQSKGNYTIWVKNRDLTNNAAHLFANAFHI